MLKRVTSILLLVIFAYSFLGAGFVYNVWLFSIKKQVKERLETRFPEEEFTVVKVPASWEDNPPADFQWHEEHEFRYRGQMYDVVRREQHGSQIWYYCYWDKAETEMLNNLSEYVSSYLMQNPQQQQKDTFLKTFLSKTFLLAQFALKEDFGLRTEFPAGNINKLLSVFLDINPPPPRMFIGIWFLQI